VAAEQLMKRARDYFGWMREPVAAPDSAAWRDTAYMVTGRDLVDRIYVAIRERRSVLVTGPRGSGKTFCSLRAIERARRDEIVGGSHFLQGNREIPRDYLSEDTLVLGSDGNAKLIEALAWRRPMDSPLDLGFQEARRLAPNPEAHVNGSGVGASLLYPLWPAVPLALGRGREGWEPRHWLVLMLDEINRFGDGFLDSLLSLMEEGVVIRQGDGVRVPLIVVATANPPGYDTTARRLSPPLQARIARAYRVAQPPIDVLMNTLLHPKFRQDSCIGVPRVSGDKLVKKSPNGSRRPEAFNGPMLHGDLLYRVVGCTLCLWGDPRPDQQPQTRGSFFLTADTVQLLEDVRQATPRLGRAMKTLSDLVDFGPDARAVQEWVGCTIERWSLRNAKNPRPLPLSADDFMDTLLEVIGHKLRESFQEGQQPQKMERLQRTIWAIAQEILTHPAIGEMLVPPYRVAAARIWRAPTTVRDDIASQRALFRQLMRLPASRRAPWLAALAVLPVASDTLALASWIEAQRSIPDRERAFGSDGRFMDARERAWLENLLRSHAGLLGKIDGLAGISNPTSPAIPDTAARLPRRAG
jgi:hypothetical protein